MFTSLAVPTQNNEHPAVATSEITKTLRRVSVKSKKHDLELIPSTIVSKKERGCWRGKRFIGKRKAKVMKQHFRKHIGGNQQ